MEAINQAINKHDLFSEDLAKVYRSSGISK